MIVYYTITVLASCSSSILVTSILLYAMLIYSSTFRKALFSSGLPEVGPRQCLPARGSEACEVSVHRSTSSEELQRRQDRGDAAAGSALAGLEGVPAKAGCYQEGWPCEPRDLGVRLRLAASQKSRRQLGSRQGAPEIRLVDNPCRVQRTSGGKSVWPVRNMMLS